MKQYASTYQLAPKLALMKYLSPRAAADLLYIIRLSLFADLASWTETMDRLLALHTMCPPKNSTRTVVERILSLNEWPQEENWEEGEIASESDVQGHGTPRSTWEHGDDIDIDDEPGFLYFYPGSQTGLAKWEFRPFDADPYPSVPHGHWEARDRPKLDPYLGWVYDRTKQVRREPKKKIIALWNDRTFRRFALETIRFHLEHFPYHKDWRVENPLRLPRRR